MKSLHILAPALDVLGNKVKILPASSGAMEDLQRPDEDELEDMLINSGIREITTFGETPTPSLSHLYRPTPPLYRSQNHLYRFFIDGSLRTYYLGTGIEGDRTFPIELAQIGAAVIKRNASGNVSTLAIDTKVLLLIPKGQYGVSDSVWAELEAQNAPDGSFQIIDTTEKSVNTPQEPTPESLRGRAGGIARNRMHQLEIAMIDRTDAYRNSENWLILDGAVKLDSFVKTANMIGVAKNFRKDPRFTLSRRPGARKDITQLLVDLPFASRTVAFSSYDGQVAFWYVRLRAPKDVDYPLMGVVKVEIPCPTREPIQTELADLLSCALVAERNVTPYGRDSRWHCHLYPIFQAEQAIKNRFYSSQVLTASIRWPQLR